MYKIIFERQVKGQLEALPKHDAIRIMRKIKALAENPRPSGIEKLKGTENCFRIRSGDYRVIFSIHDHTLIVLVVKIGHRRDVSNF